MPSRSLDPIPIGYQAKRIATQPDWLEAAGVEEICSVSNCISCGLETWGSNASQWTHNGLGLWDNEISLQDILAAEAGQAAFNIFSYLLLPVAFGPDGETPITHGDMPDFAGPRPAAEPPDRTFEAIGFDCVATEWNLPIAGFGCSPLSCNYMAREIPVNRHCLIDRLEEAIAAARHFAKEQPEPGTYYVVEVWRKRRGEVTLDEATPSR